MMRVFKMLFKPILAIVIFVVVGVLLTFKKSICFFHIKAFYKNIAKLDNTVLKLYSVVFNPYRICNGFRPNTAMVRKPSPSDIEVCHQIVQSKKQQSNRYANGSIIL